MLLQYKSSFFFSRKLLQKAHFVFHHYPSFSWAFLFQAQQQLFFAKAISFLEVDMLHFTVTFFLKESNRELDIESGQLDTFCKLSSKSHLLFLCYHGWAWIGCKLKDVVIRQESTSSSENSKDTILLTKARHSSQP